MSAHYSTLLPYAFVQITSGYLFAETNTALSMAAYAVQAELGDFNPVTHEGRDYFVLDKYVPEHVLASTQRSELVRRISGLHHGLRGMSNVDAEREFCNEAQRLPDCGISFHPLAGGTRSAGRRSSNSLTLQGHEPQLFLGAGARGLFLYEGTADRKRQTDLRLGCVGFPL